MPLIEYICKIGIYIKKTNNQYTFDNEIKVLFNKQQEEENLKHSKVIDGLEKSIRKHEFFQNSGIDEELNFRDAVAKFIAHVNSVNASNPDSQSKQKIAESLQTIATTAKLINDGQPEESFFATVLEWLPNFIYFSDFDDILPFEIPLTEAKKHKTVLDFATVANLDLDKVIATTDTQRRRNILSEHSAHVSGDFKGFWGQNEIALVAEPNGQNLIIGLKEAGETRIFKAEQRSKGFQWFLSFYLRLTAQKHNYNIILIDEPGLYLHAKAQRDVLKVLESIAQAKTTVIFSTHSPYLIDVNRLDRIRLVMKKENGSLIENKIHKNADAETLTPIIAAIGMDLQSHFTGVKKHNAVLEGISDYYYLQALKDLIPKSKLPDINFIPCVGATKIPQIISLLIGWDLDYVAVLDKDSEGKRTAKELLEELHVAGEKVLFVSGEENTSIEDLFSRQDFNTHVLEDVKNEKETSNSKFLKEQKLDKVLLAKKFFERGKKDKKSIKLEETTISNFSKIFDHLSSVFK